MKKLFLYAFLGLMIYNMAVAQSLLPECEGNDKKVIEAANNADLVRAVPGVRHFKH